MNSITLNVPAAAVVKGELLCQYSIQDLDQDILEVELPNGVVIDVGWFPQYDPKGHFRLSVYHLYRNEPLRPPIDLETPFQVAKAVEEVVTECGSSIFQDGDREKGQAAKIPAD
jgi:hypothetical protein